MVFIFDGSTTHVVFTSWSKILVQPLTFEMKAMIMTISSALNGGILLGVIERYHIFHNIFHNCWFTYPLLTLLLLCTDRASPRISPASLLGLGNLPHKATKKNNGNKSEQWQSHLLAGLGYSPTQFFFFFFNKKLHLKKY